MIAPKAQANFALTVNLIFSPSSLAPETSSIQDTFHVRYDDELFTPLGDEADELRLPMHADARRLLHIGPRDLGDLVDLVGGDADQDRLIVDADLDHDDPCLRGGFGLRHPETDAQVGQRN